MTTHQIRIDYEVWGKRWPEIEAYAAKRGIPVERALVELIDKGLSHLDDD